MRLSQRGINRRMGWLPLLAETPLCFPSNLTGVAGLRGKRLRTSREDNSKLANSSPVSSLSRALPRAGASGEEGGLQAPSWSVGCQVGLAVRWGFTRLQQLSFSLVTLPASLRACQSLFGQRCESFAGANPAPCQLDLQRAVGAVLRSRAP